MKRLTIVLLFLTTVSLGQEYKTVKYQDIYDITRSQAETLYVFNFWNNWSYESKKELPLLDGIESKYKDEKIKVILVCIDVEEDFEEWVIPFLKEMKLKTEVWWLDEPDIHRKKYRIDRHWVKEVPFTLIIRPSIGQRYWKDGGRWREKHLYEVIDDLMK